MNESVVLLTTGVFAQLCNHHEMQVSVSSMPRGRSFISMLGEESEQVTSGICKLRRWKANVFDDEVCALRTHFTDDAEETITNMPCKLNGFGVANEFQRLQHFHIAQSVSNPVLDHLKFLVAIEAEFNQEGRVLRIKIFPILRRTFHQFGGSGQG